MRVHAAGVDRGAWHLMSWLPYPVRLVVGVRTPKARVRGMEFAGRVAGVGSGVTGFKVGDEVFGIGEGTFAEYATAKAGTIAPKPASLSFEQAAAVGVSACTALRRDSRHRWQPSAERVAARTHPAGQADHHRRRDQRPIARRHRPAATGDGPVAVHRPDTAHVRRHGGHRRPGRARRAHRTRHGDTGHRPGLPGFARHPTDHERLLDDMPERSRGEVRVLGRFVLLDDADLTLVGLRRYAVAWCGASPGSLCGRRFGV